MPSLETFGGHLEGVYEKKPCINFQGTQLSRLSFGPLGGKIHK